VFRFEVRFEGRFVAIFLPQGEYVRLLLAARDIEAHDSWLLTREITQFSKDPGGAIGIFEAN